MNRTVLLLALLLAVGSGLSAQDITYGTDTTCGCDIVFVNGIQTTREGDLYGFRRYDGTILTPNIYRYVGTFTDGYCHVWMDDTSVHNPNLSEPPLLCGLIDTTGRQILPCIYDNIGEPSEGRIPVSSKGYSGYTDLNGRIVIPLRYLSVGPFSCGRAPVSVAVDSVFVYYTYLDTLGTPLFDPIFEQALPYSEGYAPVQRYDRWGLIDLQGNEVLPITYEVLTPPDHLTVFAGDKFGLALFCLPEQSPRKHLAPSTPFDYVPLARVADNRIAVARNGQQGFLNLQGDEVIPCAYDEVGAFRSGRAMVRNGDLYGIIDTLGDTILPIAYTNNSKKGYKYTYYNDLALVEQGGRLGFVDLQGHFVVPLILEEAYHFSEGLAPVRKHGQWGYINTDGELFLPLVFDLASPFQWNRADVVFHGQSLKIDTTGRCVHNCRGIIGFWKE